MIPFKWRTSRSWESRNTSAGSIRDKIAVDSLQVIVHVPTPDREAHVLLQPGTFSVARGITRRKSRELMVKRIPRGPSRNFMRDVVSTCVNIHMCSRRVGVQVQACEQYEVP